MSTDHASDITLELERLAEERRKWHKLQSLLIIAMVVVIVVGGGLFFWKHKSNVKQKEVDARADQVWNEFEQARQGLSDVRQQIAAQNAEQEKRVSEYADRCKRKAAEKLAQQEREAAEKLAQDEMQKRQQQAKANALKIKLTEQERQREENYRTQKELEANRNIFCKAVDILQNENFNFIKELSENKRPGKCVGEFYYVIPGLEDNEIIVCKSIVGGLESVYCVNSKGKKKAVDANGFLESIAEKDYLVGFEGDVYFHSKRKKPHVGVLDKMEETDVIGEFFGDVAAAVRWIDMDIDALSFEIVFVPKGSKNIIITETINYGAKYSLNRVQEALEEKFPMKANITKVQKAKKKYKRTVMFWEGAHIKKGVDGVTYVPRTMPASTISTMHYNNIGDNSRISYNYYKRERRAQFNREYWQSLYNEAVKQDREEAQYYEREREKAREKEQSEHSQAEQEYSEKIERIFNDGTLYFRAKIGISEDDLDLL